MFASLVPPFGILPHPFIHLKGHLIVEWTPSCAASVPNAAAQVLSHALMVLFFQTFRFAALVTFGDQAVYSCRNCSVLRNAHFQTHTQVIRTLPVVG